MAKVKGVAQPDDERDFVSRVTRLRSAGRAQAQKKGMIEGPELPDLTATNPFVALATIASKGRVPGSANSSRAAQVQYRFGFVGGSTGAGWRVQRHERKALGAAQTRALAFVQWSLREAYLESIGGREEAAKTPKEHHRAAFIAYCAQSVNDARDEHVVFEDGAAGELVDDAALVAALVSPAQEGSPVWYVRLSSAPRHERKDTGVKAPIADPLAF